MVEILLQFLNQSFYNPCSTQKKCINKIIPSSKDLPFHWFFVNDSTTTNITSSMTKGRHHGLQFFMHCPYMFTIYFKGQILNFKIKIKYPFHLDVFMLTLKQQLEGPKRVCNKVHNTFCTNHLGKH